MTGGKQSPPAHSKKPADCEPAGGKSKRPAAGAPGRCKFPRTKKTESQPDNTDRKSTRLNSSHLGISYAVFCLKKKNTEYDSNYSVQKLIYYGKFAVVCVG